MELSQDVLNAMTLILIMSLPVVGAATVVGLLIGLLQALTQIQDQTLPQGLKLAAAVIVIIALGGAMSERLLSFAIHVFERVPTG